MRNISSLIGLRDSKWIKMHPISLVNSVAIKKKREQSKLRMQYCFDHRCPEHGWPKVTRFTGYHCYNT